MGVVAITVDRFTEHLLQCYFWEPWVKKKKNCYHSQLKKKLSGKTARPRKAFLPRTGLNYKQAPTWV